MANDRRKFLKAMGLGAMAAAFPPSIQRALAIPAHRRTGTIFDVEHVVFLMQENRSFDQYFGTLRGVRGFGDPRAVNLPSGEPVWYQPDGADRVLPFRPEFPNVGLQFFEDVAHGWNDSHLAFNGGKYDKWIEAKGTTGMIYMTREDLSVYGQNGFFRSFKGSVAGGDKANLTTRTFYDRAGGVTVEIVNRGSRSVNLRIVDAYTRQVVTRPLGPGRTFIWHWSSSTSFGWYDLTITVDSDPTFRQQIAGHVETGRDSASDPLLGA